jgi:hypothetical protein
MVDWSLVMQMSSFVRDAPVHTLAVVAYGVAHALPLIQVVVVDVASWEADLLIHHQISS